MKIKHLVMFSGGACSYIAAKRVIERHGREGTVLLFADTLIEDPTLYEFLDAAAERLGVEVTRVSDGRTPFEVFSDVRFLGNSRVDPCSRILKRDLLNNWRKEHCDPEVTVTHFGLDFNEPHRLKKVRNLHAPWKVEAYLIDERPVVTKEDMLDEIKADGLTPCDLYVHGFKHANCGGGCIKSGIAQFELLLRVHPERFKVWEDAERMMRQKLDKDISILKDRRGGTTKPLTLEALRKRMVCGGQLTFDEEMDWGGCGCAVE